MSYETTTLTNRNCQRIQVRVDAEDLCSLTAIASAARDLIAHVRSHIDGIRNEKGECVFCGCPSRQREDGSTDAHRLDCELFHLGAVVPR